MRLRHIEVFHAVMQTGSVSKAAELLGAELDRPQGRLPLLSCAEATPSRPR